jgi:hypothetical protein
MAVVMEYVLEDRDVEAALYLLSRMLGVETTFDMKDRLTTLKQKLERTRKITNLDRYNIVTTYREIIG